MLKPKKKVVKVINKMNKDSFVKLTGTEKTKRRKDGSVKKKVTNTFKGVQWMPDGVEKKTKTKYKKDGSVKKSKTVSTKLKDLRAYDVYTPESKTKSKTNKKGVTKTKTITKRKKGAKAKTSLKSQKSMRKAQVKLDNKKSRDAKKIARTVKKETPRRKVVKTKTVK